MKFHFEYEILSNWCRFSYGFVLIYSLYDSV